MNSNKKWETIVSIIVLVIIISISFLWLYKIIQSDNKFSSEFKRKNYLELLKNNTNSIVEKLDLSKLQNKEPFFIYKNVDKIQIMTWIINSKYQYIDYLWNFTNNLTDKNNLFTRKCIYYKDIDISKWYFCELK